MRFWRSLQAALRAFWREWKRNSTSSLKIRAFNGRWWVEDQFDNLEDYKNWLFYYKTTTAEGEGFINDVITDRWRSVSS